jgi:hypothetical protein
MNPITHAQIIKSPRASEFEEVERDLVLYCIAYKFKNEQKTTFIKDT